MLIGVLFLPTTNWLHKLTHHQMPTFRLLGCSLLQGRSSRNIGIWWWVCEANSWLIEREPRSTWTLRTSRDPLWNFFLVISKFACFHRLPKRLKLGGYAANDAAAGPTRGDRLRELALGHRDVEDVSFDQVLGEVGDGSQDCGQPHGTRAWGRRWWELGSWDELQLHVSVSSFTKMSQCPQA